MLARAAALAEMTRAANHYERTLQYLYLSETRGSFAIERETPSASKEERFIQILRHAADIPRLTEDVLVEIQNAIVRHDFAKEASYRTRQKWLENAAGRITFLPHPPDTLRETMAGWEALSMMTSVRSTHW
jgi:surfactin synthase thioesterase subunit